MADKYYELDYCYETIMGAIQFIGNTTDKPGYNGQYFYMDFIRDTPDYLKKGDIITDSTGTYKIKLVDDPVNYKYNYYRYKCMINSNNPNDYIPVEFLQKGTLWKKL